MKKHLITIVIPAFNEEDNLPELFARLDRVTRPLKDYNFEFLLINNCSEDETGKLAMAQSEKDPRWRYLKFSRNFGFETSLAAGLHYARGAALIFLASDLQDPPENIPAMLNIWRQEKCDVVYGSLLERNDSSWLKSFGARIAYWMIYRFSDIKIPPNATDFRLIARPAIEALNRCQERNRYLRGLVHWVGFRQVALPYKRHQRTHGHSTAGLIHCLNFTISALIAFSTRPLRWASALGLMATVASVLGAILYTVLTIITYFGLSSLTPAPPGWATQMLLIFFFGGIQCLFLGILGEYVGRIFEEVKQRPQWVIEEARGFGASMKDSIVDFSPVSKVVRGNQPTA